MGTPITIKGRKVFPNKTALVNKEGRRLVFPDEEVEKALLSGFETPVFMTNEEGRKITIPYSMRGDLQEKGFYETTDSIKMSEERGVYPVIRMTHLTKGTLGVPEDLVPEFKKMGYVEGEPFTGEVEDVKLPWVPEFLEAPMTRARSAIATGAAGLEGFLGGFADPFAHGAEAVSMLDAPFSEQTRREILEEKERTQAISRKAHPYTYPAGQINSSLILLMRTPYVKNLSGAKQAAAYGFLQSLGEADRMNLLALGEAGISAVLSAGLGKGAEKVGGALARTVGPKIGEAARKVARRWSEKGRGMDYLYEGAKRKVIGEPGERIITPDSLMDEISLIRARADELVKGSANQKSLLRYATELEELLPKVKEAGQIKGQEWLDLIPSSKAGILQTLIKTVKGEAGIDLGLLPVAGALDWAFGTFPVLSGITAAATPTGRKIIGETAKATGRVAQKEAGDILAPIAEKIPPVSRKAGEAIQTAAPVAGAIGPEVWEAVAQKKPEWRQWIQDVLSRGEKAWTATQYALQQSSAEFRQAWKEAQEEITNKPEEELLGMD